MDTVIYQGVPINIQTLMYVIEQKHRLIRVSQKSYKGYTNMRRNASVGKRLPKDGCEKFMRAYDQLCQDCMKAAIHYTKVIKPIRQALGAEIKFSGTKVKAVTYNGYEITKDKFTYQAASYEMDVLLFGEEKLSIPIDPAGFEARLAALIDAHAKYKKLYG